MLSDLVRIHHADYIDDIQFWVGHTRGLDPILEIGCGHGRVTLPLLEEGRFVVGIDRDRETLAYLNEVLKTYSLEIRQRITLVNEDILDFHPDMPFGSVIIPCNTYSTFSAADRLRLLKIIYASLKDGGSLIASIPNPQQTLEIFSGLSGSDQDGDPDLEKIISHPETGFPVQISSRLRAAEESLVWDWIYDHLQPDGGVEREVVTVEHFPEQPDQLLAEVREAGFRKILCQGDFAGGQYSVSSPYLILICQR